MIDLKLRVFIPAPAVLIPLPVVGDVGYGGDNRDFSFEAGTSRAEIWADVDNSPQTSTPLTIKRREFGASHMYHHEKLVDVVGKPVWWKAVKRVPLLDVEMEPDATLTADLTPVSLAVTASVEPVDAFGLLKNVRVSLHVQAAVPFDSLAPAIDCNLDVLLSATGTPTGFAYSVSGTHDGFPAYELYVQRRRIYSHDPVQAGKSPFDLFPPEDVLAQVPTTVFL